jgi:aspartokinase
MVVVVAQLSVVYKFGGSSVATADRMREVAAIVCSFPDQAPLVVLSAMGKVLVIPFLPPLLPLTCMPH